VNSTEIITPVEALVGWRFFAPLVRTKNREPILGSCVRRMLWPKRERLEAVCGSLDEAFPYSCKEFPAKEEKYETCEIRIDLLFTEDGGIEIGGPHSVRKVSTVHKFTPGREDIVPSREGSCGVYGCKTQEDLLSRTHFKGVLFGTASYWGRVVEGTFGYRARFCYPKSLCGGVCGECHKTLGVGQLALYRFSEKRRSRYERGVQKYIVLCGGCYWKKPRKSARSLLGKEREQYLGALAREYGIVIE
jgi:hypothetical protein